MIKLNNVFKTYNNEIVLSSVNLQISPLDRLVVLGENGAGKSTLIKIIAGLSSAVSGEVVNNARSISYLDHKTSLYDDLTALENLIFYGKIYNVKDVKLKALRLLDLVGLLGKENIQLFKYSRGMRQRVALARVFLPDSDLIIMDEPLTGLDIRGRDMVLSFYEMYKDKTFITVSHDAVLLDVSNRAIVVNSGKVIFSGKPEDCRYFHA